MIIFSMFRASFFMSESLTKKTMKIYKTVHRYVKYNKKQLKIKCILFCAILIFFLFTKKILFTKLNRVGMDIETYEFINMSVDKCLEHNTRYEQNKEFASIRTTLPLTPLKMTLTTAVFLDTSDDAEYKVLKRIIINKKTPIYEDKIALKLDHPNIVKAHKSFITSYKDETLLWMYMEYLPVKILQSNIKSDEEKIRMIGYDLLKGLEYLHLQNIAHLDLKIGNIMGHYDNGTVRYKIIDFGYSRVVDNEVCIPGKNYGTFPYKSPEVVIENIHGLSSDIWCVGSIMLFLKMGRTPFYTQDNKKQKKLYNEFIQGEYDMVYPKDTSAELKDLIRACMQLERTKRPNASLLLKHRFFMQGGIMFGDEQDEYSEYSSGYDSTDETIDINIH